MLHTFDKKIQLYPALAAEHIMLSMAEGAAAANLAANASRTIAIAPLDVAIFATSLLGTMYYRLSNQSHIKRIVYLWSDAAVEKNKLLVPKATGIKQVLGKTIPYAPSEKVLQDSALSSQMYADDGYFSTSEFWYAHVHYASFLPDVELCPLVFSQDIALSDYVDVLTQEFFGGDDTMVILSDNLRFKMKDSDQGSHILTLKHDYYSRFDVFCFYCDAHTLLPTIMRVELLDQGGSVEDKTYQGILLV